MIVRPNSKAVDAAIPSALGIAEPTNEFELLFRSKEQQYRFNHPYQCGTNSPPPTMADHKEHQVRHQDLVVFASDGVLDNIFDNDIIDCLKLHFSEKISL